jgi:hypothetical protein
MMRNPLVPALVVGILAVGVTPAGADKPPPAKQLSCKVRVCFGDPLGDERKGSLKVVADLHLVCFESKTASYFSGAEALSPTVPPRFTSWRSAKK